MKGFNFLPKGYIYKKYNKINKVVSIVNIIIFTISVCLLITIYRNFLYYKEISNSKIELNRTAVDLNDSLQASVKTTQNDTKANMIYSEIRNEIGDREFETIEISKNEGKVKILHPTLEDYIVFVKSIEKGKNFEIIDLQPPVKHDNYIDNYITIKYIK